MAEMEQPESPPRPFPTRSPEYNRDPFRGDRFARYNNDDFAMNSAASSSSTVEDPKSCFVVLTMFSFFVAIFMALGLYSPETMRLGPNASILIKPNPLFVESVEVVEVGGSKGSMLYGFYENPPLVETRTWQETHKIPLPYNMHKEWVYYLNKGSQINISYSVTSWGSSSIVLVIAKGNNQLAEWLKDPSYPDTTFSWNMIYGNGSLQKNILKSSVYYIGVGNLNHETVTVNLNMTIEALLYDTTESYYKCSPADGKCTFQLFSMSGNAAVLTSQGQVPGMSNCRVKISYGHRWITYVFVAGGMILLMRFIIYFRNDFRRSEQNMPTDQLGGNTSDRNPLLSQKDANNSDSEGEDHKDDAKAGFEPKPANDDEDSRRFCAICFEAPKDSFFVPCGHCVACFRCATRILETSATCPVCRRKTEKVTKIYTV